MATDTIDHKSSSKAVVDSKTAASKRRGSFLRKKSSLIVVALFAVFGAGLLWARAATTTYSIWSNSAVPKTISDTDTNSVELGTVFSSKYAGQVTGVRFYKSAQNTGTHTGSLWDLKGHMLATVTFTNETASGWQTATFPQPVKIAANSPYIISYHAPKGHYSDDSGYFANSQYVNGPLKAVQDTTAHHNGVYSYAPGTSYPNKTYQSTNYWVDVVFSTNLINPSPKPAPPTNVQAVQNGSAIFVSWTAAISSNPLTSYQVIRDGSSIATVASTKQSYSDSNVVAGKTYTYQIKSVDNTSAVSDASVSASVTYNVAVSCPSGETGTPPNCAVPTPPPTTGGGTAINCPEVDSAVAIECWDAASGVRGADGGKSLATIETTATAGTDAVLKYKLTGPGILTINADGSASWSGGTNPLPAAATTRTVNGTVQHGLFNTWVHNACVVNKYDGGQYNNDLITQDGTFQVNGNCTSDGSCAAASLALGCSNNSSQDHLSFATASYVTVDGGNQQVDSIGIGSGGYTCSHCTVTRFIHNWWAGAQVNISESYGGDISNYYYGPAGTTGQLHRETIDADSANNVTVNHNYLRIDPACPNNCGQVSSAMMNGGSWAPPSHIVVSNNFLEGGAGADMSGGCGSSYVVVTNNAFSSSNGYGGGEYIYGYNVADPGNVFTGNYIPEKNNAPVPDPGNGGC